ncbi:MAG TPA: hypothetical protein VFQ13_07490 [Anaerolineales bacterium]|nr:hypothetical protein [Anaerolineales bacterium]
MKTETYTNKQAMDKLGLTSRSAFYHFKRTYPQSFVVVNQGTDSSNVTVYDKQALDKLMEILECVKTQAHKAS